MLTAAASEVELKLRVPPDAYAQLLRHPVLRDDREPDIHRLYAIYFDTPQQDLWRAGLALRVRRDGASWTQTLKGGGSADAGLHTRIEIESPIARPLPDLALLPEGPWVDKAAAIVAGRALRRVFATQFARTTRLLRRAPDALIEASLDRGVIRTSGASESFCELELELKAGSPGALYDLALELFASVPVAVDNESKAERGYALHNGIDGQPKKASTVALAPGMTVEDALEAVVRTVLSHVQANGAGLLRHSDPEYVHQLRVALRRLRSAFSVFRPVVDGATAERIVPQIRGLARVLGAARDWDVFIENACAQALAAFPDHAGVQAYAREFRRRQKLARRKAQRAIGSPRYQRLLLELGAWLHARRWRECAYPDAPAILERPVTTYAADVLEARYTRMRKRGRRIEEHSPEELHALRIAAKKLRYAAHFFARLYDEERVQALLARLARLQDALGALNDAATVQALVDGASPDGAPRDIAEAHGILVAWSRGQTTLLRREAERAWRALRRCPAFW